MTKDEFDSELFTTKNYSVMLAYKNPKVDVDNYVEFHYAIFNNTTNVVEEWAQFYHQSISMATQLNELMEKQAREQDNIKVITGNFKSN